MTELVSVRIPIETAQRLKALAEAMQRSKSFLGAQAIEEFVEAHEWQLAEWLAAPNTFLHRMANRPPLIEAGLWPTQIVAIRNLEASIAANKPRALSQMATGSGKTFTAINFIYRLIKFAGARRVLFLVDRRNLGRQTKKEFDR